MELKNPGTPSAGDSRLATEEAEIRRIVVQSQSQSNSSRDPISKKKKKKAITRKS
jgi:hypothetical protein